MTPKWTIRKYAVSSLGDEVALPWMLFQPGVIPPETFHEAYWAACSMQETFNEVLAYMKSQTCKARTVTTELPAVKPGQHKFLQNSYVRVVTAGQSASLVDISDNECVHIDMYDWKELGEYLLALHYEKENQ